MLERSGRGREAPTPPPQLRWIREALASALAKGSIADMVARSEPPREILDKLRLTCLDLPEAYEEKAWVGTRWLVRKKTFAHVLMLEAGWPPAYAQAVGAAGPLCLLTFRLPESLLASDRFGRAPFFRPPWFPNIVGVALGPESDWLELSELLVHSYCVLAPKALVARVRGA